MAGDGARWVSSTVVMCVAPRAEDGGAMQVALEVSGNGGADFTKDGIDFVYEASATVESLVPSWGVSGKAGQAVTVLGRHFARSSELSCRVGLGGNVRGQFESSTMVTCKVPERGSGTVTVSVSNNAVEFSSGGALFDLQEFRSGFTTKLELGWKPSAIHPF